MTQQAISPQQARVLVVEDDPNNRLVVVKLLQVSGVPPENVFEAEGDVVQFLRDRAGGQVDLILLDLQLPIKDGYTILRELRADPQVADIPVVALTANVMQTDVERTRQAGFDGFIGKPIDGLHFPEHIRSILAGQRIWRVR